MDRMDFEDIRPYTDAEFKEAYYRLMEDPRFKDALRLCLQNYNVEDFRKDLDKFQTIEEVQVDFDKRFLDVFLSQSTKGIALSGIENLEEDKTYMFIGNHRDITLDPALLQYYFFIEKKKTSRIAMGDNLFTTPLLGEIAKLNKMIKVKRGGTMREKLVNFQKLAAYIQYSLFEDKESVWIAQRDGRTKDGNDYTKQGLLKMITMGNDKNLLETMRRMNITPLTVSYEYESCDKMKARELALSENGPYVKEPGEDFNSIKQGIFGQKGRVALTIGHPLGDELDLVPENLNNNDKLYFVCKLIDKQIYKNYVLYPNNYIAHDLMHQNQEYAHHYTPEEKSKFEAYLEMQSHTSDVPEEKMRANLLKIYATPVDNYMKAISEEN
ncbi:MAG: 1-acyl-sn-glycerol-3-phosphate acyltransferase [Bacteroidales bacterium]|nr:1-acyl-sn-glycerol-3-phosphate acyltransferase [Bacteroidales bacterium]